MMTMLMITVKLAQQLMQIVHEQRKSQQQNANNNIRDAESSKLGCFMVRFAPFSTTTLIKHFIMWSTALSLDSGVSPHSTNNGCSHLFWECNGSGCHTGQWGFGLGFI